MGNSNNQLSKQCSLFLCSDSYLHLCERTASLVQSQRYTRRTILESSIFPACKKTMVYLSIQSSCVMNPSSSLSRVHRLLVSEPYEAIPCHSSPAQDWHGASADDISSSSQTSQTSWPEPYGTLGSIHPFGFCDVTTCLRGDGKQLVKQLL